MNRTPFDDHIPLTLEFHETHPASCVHARVVNDEHGNWCCDCQRDIFVGIVYGEVVGFDYGIIFPH